MATNSQPIQPVFAETYDLPGNNLLGIIKLVTDHQRDFMSIKTNDTQNTYTREFILGADTYDYDASTGVFTYNVTGTGAYYIKSLTSLNYYTNTIEYIRDVYAKLRPVEIRFADRKFYDASKVFLRVGIAKQILQAQSAETTATLKIFDGAFNLSNQTNAITDITTPLALYTYELQEDVNVGVATARVNGLRSYLLTELPLATDTDTGCSFEVGMTNEGRLFDYMIIAKASEQGQQ